MMDFIGRHVVITGASSGIGLATAAKIVSLGGRVTLRRLKPPAVTTDLRSTHNLGREDGNVTWADRKRITRTQRDGVLSDIGGESQRVIAPQHRKHEVERRNREPRFVGHVCNV